MSRKCFNYSIGHTKQPFVLGKECVRNAPEGDVPHAHSMIILVGLLGIPGGRFIRPHSSFVRSPYFKIKIKLSPKRVVNRNAY